MGSERCDNNCKDCKEKCEEAIIKEKTNEFSRVKKVVGIVSGKGGVGKSLVTSLMAVLMRREGYKTAILDADITGPSIPKAFGITKGVEGSDFGISSAKSTTGISIMSANLLLKNPTDPVIWRGPMIANMVKQFWTDVLWYDQDIMFIDMPPGTGDVPLTVFQSIPVDGIIIVTSPQELVSMIVQKAVVMAEKMNIPILGLVENMSYAECPDCGKRIEIFGKSKLEELAKKYNLEILGKIPIDTKLASAADSGLIELFEGDWLQKATEKVSEILES